jgi:cysteinyl-tRNA synthetase
MKLFELEQLVRENTEDYRLYNWKEVERMREQLAATSMLLSNRKLSTDNKILSLLKNYRQELRNNKEYKTSDRIREILELVGVKDNDEKN